MQDFRQLNVWHKSHALVLRIYMATSTFPDSERYGITSQMRRAATSIPANIAEGCARSGPAELRQFLYVSAGSASELDYFLLLARDLRLFTPKQHETLYASLQEIRRMLTGLIQKVERGASVRSNCVRAADSRSSNLRGHSDVRDTRVTGEQASDVPRTQKSYESPQRGTQTTNGKPDHPNSSSSLHQQLKTNN